MPGSRRQDVWINNVSLRSVDARIIVARIEEPDPEVEMEFTGFGSYPGRFVTGKPLRRAKTVRVYFRIRELYDLTARAAVLEKVNAWAQDGVMKLSSRPGRMLRVLCTKRAGGGDLREYTTEYMIEFQTHIAPFWESDNPVSTSGSATSLSIVIPGSTQSIIETVQVTATSVSGTMALFTISAGSEFLTFKTGMIADDVLTISHTDDGLMEAKLVSGTTETNLLPLRTALSSDELFVDPGPVTVTFAAYDSSDDAITFSGTASIAARGRWL